MLHDIRYALRMLLKQPSFTTVAVLALTIGIGANTAIFSVVNAVLLRPLSFPEAEELVVVLEQELGRPGSGAPVAPGNYGDIRRDLRSFAQVGAAEMWSAALTGDQQPEQISGLRMSSSVFDVLGMAPMIGRTFREQEEEPGRHRVAVLTYSLWSRSFGADPAIAGRTVTLSGEPFEILGVMPPEFRFPPFWATKADIYVPLSFTPERHTTRGGNSLRLFARLKDGVPIAEAQNELDLLAARLAGEYPATNTRVGFAATPLHEMVVGKVRTALLLLSGAVGLLLLIACSNVANLLLARSVVRQKEIAVRLALGARRARIIRQLVTEAAVLSGIAGVLGIVLALWGVEAIRSAFDHPGMTGTLPRLQDASIDLPALIFTGAAAMITALLFGVFPAFQVSRSEVQGTLKETARSIQSGRGGNLQRWVVGAQVALTVMLLAGAGLLGRTFWRMLSIDPGFRAEGVLTAVVNVAGTSVSPVSRQVEFYRGTLAQLSGMPGVTDAAAINHLPLAGDTWGRSFLIEGQPVPAPGERNAAVYRVISPGYFKTMGTRILRGREFSLSDVKGAEPVTVINETMAKRYWPDGDPIGKRLRLGGSDEWLAVAGIAQDIKQRQWTESPESELYINYLQHPDHFGSRPASSMTFVLRTSGDPATLIKPLQDAVWSADRRIPLTGISTMEQVAADSIRQQRVYAVLLGIFAAAALALATIGIYGVVSYAVAQRAQEIGIRIALGAAPADMVRMVIGQGMKVVALGIAAGLAGSLSLARAISALLFGVTPFDFVTFCGVCLLALAVAFTAMYFPARRVTRIDPAAALRFE